MFSDETEQLIQESIDQRDLVVTARGEAKVKTAARTAAAVEEGKALDSLAMFKISAAEAQTKAIAAIVVELSVPAEEPTPPPPPVPHARSTRGLPAMAGR